MFDPTIFDNLKVVLEGCAYDLDAEGAIRITGREDLVDLASMQRTFTIRLAANTGACLASVSLSSGLTDFAGELRRLRIAGDRPGAELSLLLQAPAAWHAHSYTYDQYWKKVFGEEATLQHELTASLTPNSVNQDRRDEAYRITASFREKLDELHLEDLEGWLALVVHGMNFMEQTANQ